MKELKIGMNKYNPIITYKYQLVKKNLTLLKGISINSTNRSVVVKLPVRYARIIYTTDQKINGNTILVSRRVKNVFMEYFIGSNKAPLIIKNKPIQGLDKYEIIP